MNFELNLKRKKLKQYFEIRNSKLEIRAFGKRKGFTMIELLMSIALITLIAGIGIPVYQSFQVKNDLDVATNNWVQTLRRAQTLSEAMDGDSTWGAKIQSGSIILFKGSSYALRDTTYDENFDMPSALTPSGLSEVVFDKLTGFPQTTGTTTLTTTTNETRTITINSKGILNY